MRVILAGYNVDAEVLEGLKRLAPGRADVTPETLSAAYARISRDPRPVDELRRAAREEVERARRSNQTIIFKMGHHSVAEHAVFNFDVLGLSRLAIEELEHFRLCSFTEKSQRYITLGEDFVIPEEIRCAGLEGEFVETVRAQNALYQSLLGRLKPYVFEKHKDLASNPRNHAVLEGWAKEDARYVVSLATEGQLGLTLNARNLELLIRRFAARDLGEIRELNQRLYLLAKEVAPSIILFTQPGDFDARTYGELAAESDRLLGGKVRSRKRVPAVRLLAATPGGDDRILASLVHTTTTAPFADCLAAVRRSSPRKKKDLVRKALVHMEFFDSPQREFEYADLGFEFVVSSSCFAQLKRHRLATLTVQPYDPDLGVTIPPSVRAVGAGRDFREVVALTEDTHARLKKAVGRAADYVLTNAHRRRVLFKANLRELYHFSRLREDPTAQWEIRRLAGEMTRSAKKAMPLTGVLLGGKEDYPRLYRRLFGRPPKTIPPRLFE
jgi:flavin-dependent thymidylate synthase